MDTEREYLVAPSAARGRAWPRAGSRSAGALIVDGEVLAVGYNKRVQLDSAIRHGETDCLENAGRLPASVYRRASDGDHVVAVRHVHRRDPAVRHPARRVGENRTFYGGEDYLRQRGVEVVVLQDDECVAMMTDFIRDHPRPLERGHRSLKAACSASPTGDSTQAGQGCRAVYHCTDLRPRQGSVRMTASSAPVQPIPPTTSLRTQVETALSAAIIAGEMPPGELFSAPALAARFNVSATPVREAMLNLEKRGFVEAVRNKGFRVTAVSEADLTDIVGVRLLLEPPAMRQLAGRYPRRSRRGAAGDGRTDRRRRRRRRPAGLPAGRHRVPPGADRAPRQPAAWCRWSPTCAHRPGWSGLVGLLGTEVLHASSVEHLDLLAALERGDGEAAEQLMHRHIEHVLGWWAGRDEPTALTCTWVNCRTSCLRSLRCDILLIRGGPRAAWT